MLATLHAEQFIPAPIEQVWPFFATPRNLPLLTPPAVKLRIVSEIPEKMYAGQLIQYRLSLVPGLWLDWLTEIRQVREQEYFADDQRVGPYKLWFHEHLFKAVPGGVTMIDHVTYGLGFGPLGRLIHWIWVRRKLEAIFEFRRRAIESIFPTLPGERGT